MKKNKILLYIVLGVIALNAICIPAYLLINNHIKKSDYRGFVDDCYEYVKNDGEFATKYGKPIDFSYSDSQKITKNKDGNGNVEIVFVFFCEGRIGRKVFCESRFNL